MHKKLLSMIMVIVMIFSGIIIMVPENTNAEYSGLSYYWDDEGGSDNLASTAANWYQMNGAVKTDDIVPSEGSHVYINESSSNIIWDLTTLIGNISIVAGYSGTFSQSSNDINVVDLYVTAGGWAGASSTYFINIYGNCYLNPASMTTDRNLINFYGDSNTCNIKNNRLYEMSFYGDYRINGLGYSRIFYVDINSTLTISTSCRIGYVNYLTNSLCTINGDIISEGNGYFAEYYGNTATTTVYQFNESLCDLRYLSGGTTSTSTILRLPGDISANYIYISETTTSSTVTFNTDSHTMNIGLKGLFCNDRVTLNLNDSTINTIGSWTSSGATVNYVTSKIVFSGVKADLTINAPAQTFYNITISSETSVQLLSNIIVSSWLALYGNIDVNGYTLNAPMFSNMYSPNLYGEELQSYIYSPNINLTYQAEIITNASFLAIENSINRPYIEGSIGGGDSGSYYVNIKFYNSIGSLWVNYTLNINDTVFCYFDSIPNTEITTGDLYLYHPVVVSNGTYALYMNNNGALVVSNITGNVTGYPIAGIYDISLYVIDSDGNIAYQNWTLTVIPFTDEWTNSRIVDITLLVIIMGIITLFNYLGYVKSLFLLQILSFIVFIFVLVPLWPGSEIGGLLVLVFGIGNIGLLIGGLMK